ncbi:MAG: Gfo/Idh/MocA family oxidoreductase [Cyanobacteria bacterium SBLK]|nr:Gfo/Idh/MocA family oxidoreductase [Cyanobacteria bacterium SBLK]
MSLGIVVLGVGRWGKHLVRNFANHPQTHLVAIVDPHEEHLTACEEKFTLDDSILLTESWESVRSHPGIDAVVIATPASTHYLLIRDALHSGYHVFVEKPLTLDPAECLELCQLAEEKGRQLFVDHTYLFNPAVVAGKQAIADGAIGNLRYGYAARTHLSPVRQDVDALWDLAIHDIGIFNTWLGQTPTCVRAVGNVWLQPEGRMEFPSDRPQLPLFDLVWAALTYPSGFQAQIHLCWSNPDKQRRLCAVGDRGTLIFDEIRKDSPLTLQRGTFQQQESRFIPIEVSEETLPLDTCEPLGRVCDRFIESILTQTPSPLSSGWVGLELVQILDALTRSLQQEGKNIFL